MNIQRRLSIMLIFLIAMLMAACGPAVGNTFSTIPAATEPAAEGFPVTVTDGLGNEVTLETKPQRIVSLTLGTDETLLDLVGPERLIAVTYLASDATTSNIADNPALAEVPNVIPMEFSAETVIALEPDLVFIGSFAEAAMIEQLQGAGVPVFVVGFFNSVDAMEQNIIDIGTLVGEVERAQNLVEVMNDRLAALDEVLAGAEGEQPRVLYLAAGGWVAGSTTTTDDIIVRAGGINAAAESGIVDWAQINEEALIEMNPDLVILSPYVPDDEFQTNPIYAEMNAIVNGRVYSVTDKCMSATSQYIVCGVEEAAKVIYPELFGE